MIIQIETKPGMSENVLDILHGLKDVIIEKVEIKDEKFLKKQSELNNIYSKAMSNPNSLKSHKDIWDDIESHSK